MEMVEEYVNASTSQYRDALDIVEEFKGEMSTMTGKCIDVGCGPGDVTNNLILPNLSPQAELIGADISIAMIDYARQKYQSEKRLSFMQLDIDSPILPNEVLERYNNVLSFYCIHWCQDPRRAFYNIFKLLQPGGTALIMFLGWNNGFDAYLAISKYTRYRPYMQDVSRFVPFFHQCANSQLTLRKMLEDIGFEIVECSRRERSFIYQNEEILKRHMLAVNPFISRIPDYLKEEFENVLFQEITRRKIFIPNNNYSQQVEYSILDKYHILVAYIKKPFFCTCSYKQ